MNKKITRRKFITMSSLGITGAYLTLHSGLIEAAMMRGGGGMGGGGSGDLLVPVMDFDGMAMFHCHILEHEDIGMMGMWHIMKGGMPPMP